MDIIIRNVKEVTNPDGYEILTKDAKAYYFVGKGVAERIDASEIEEVLLGVLAEKKSELERVISEVAV